MEIDKEQLREYLLWLLNLIYSARAEVIAYQAAHAAHALLKVAGVLQEFDQLLEQIRNTPSPALLADHQAARDTIERLLREERVDDALEFLRKWEPKGPIQ